MNMSTTSGVLEKVVMNDLCTGCGVCVYACRQQALSMGWNDLGFMVPRLTGPCNAGGACLRVCPFNPFPAEQTRTENELAGYFLADARTTHPRLGRYTGIYAGYAPEYRLTSSSGGLATWVFAELLRQGVVDHIVSVKPSGNSDIIFEYSITSRIEFLREASKTRYYPVTLGSVLPEVAHLSGRVALIGVGCFIKAIRLAQCENLALLKKIPFLAGIICGGIKSRFFAEYLAGKAGVGRAFLSEPEFRIKDEKSTADDYAFGCYDECTGTYKTIRMNSLGDMWGTGMFKARACDYCDDLTTELADISLGDAWIRPYSEDGRGASVVITRSQLAERLVRAGIEHGKVNMEELTPDRLLASQRGNLNHRITGLPVRLARAEKLDIPIPPKRFGRGNVPPDFRWVQRFRMHVRQKSLETWRKEPDALKFDRSMKKHLLALKLATRVYHYRMAIAGKIRQRST